MEKSSLPLQEGETSACLDFMARFSLGVSVFLSPFRAHVVLLARPLEPVYDAYTGFHLFWGDIFLVIALMLWAASLILKPRPLTTVPRFLTLPLAGVTLASGISIFFSVDAPLSLYHTARLLLLDGLYLFVVNEVRSSDSFIVPVAAMVLVQATVAVGQSLRQQSLGLARLGEWPLDPAWSGVSVVELDGTRLLRAYGLTDHPNLLGGVLAFGLTLLAGWHIAAKTRWRAVVVAIFSLGLAALFLTFSRSAWLAWLAGLLGGGAILLKRRRYGELRDGLALLLASAVVAFPFVWQGAPYLGVRLNRAASFTRVAAENRSLSERAALNRAANDLFAAHPLTGIGAGAFPTALRLQRPDFPFNYQPPHVALLNAAVETGVGGGLAYLAALATPWLALALTRRRLPLSTPLLTASALLLAVTVVGFFDYYPWLLTPGRMWQWLAWGLWGSLYRRAQDEVRHA